ncbi:MAG: hypothetical protein ACK2UM_20005 [Anaerolineales bacterium]|jgi:hypothetical protein
MLAGEIVRYLAVWGIIGAFLFSLFVIFVFRSRLVYTSRKEDGLLKEKIPLAGYLTSGGFLVLIVVFLVAANYFGLYQKGYPLNFWSLFALNFSLYLILFLFDSLVIDGLVLGYWRPAFLQLPAAMGGESMREHILKSIPVGIVFGVIICLVCSAASIYFFD